MSRHSVTTITCNPTIDLSSEADEVCPTHKIRTYGERMDPGGGGINVARVLKRFGVAVQATFLAGGVTGRVLDDLLARADIARHWLRIAGDTRLSMTVHERSTGKEFRFVPEGPCVDEAEWSSAVRAAASSEADWLVLSGSLPRCAPDDLYARMTDRKDKSVRVLLDTSGEALRAAVQAGGLFLIKPSRSELEELAGCPLPSPEDLGRAAMEIARTGQVQQVVVTLGRDGAILADRNGAHLLPAVPVETRSAVGAGDSFLAAMTAALVGGKDMLEAFRWGVAAGAATAMTPGTDLCHWKQVEELLQRVDDPRPVC
ncbi:1-phosphofructokinase family hexose kinase [Sphingomonas sp. GCM10030256]|uniref:1-phosphofructokinase family hexose kinase n=1 Tax=Sphingomonas sp. GCM10030256 TaxID=3273427 RepID=UPI00361F66A6